VEIAAPDCRGGNSGSGNRGSRESMESEGFKNVFLSSWLHWLKIALWYS